MCTRSIWCRSTSFFSILCIAYIVLRYKNSLLEHQSQTHEAHITGIKHHLTPEQRSTTPDMKAFGHREPSAANAGSCHLAPPPPPNRQACHAAMTPPLQPDCHARGGWEPRHHYPSQPLRLYRWLTPMAAWRGDVIRGHYIRNSNRRHISEMRANVIISDLEKWDASASPRHRSGSMQSKKETIFFLVHLK
jgi:hypothetical protein